MKNKKQLCCEKQMRLVAVVSQGWGFWQCDDCMNVKQTDVW